MVPEQFAPAEDLPLIRKIKSERTELETLTLEKNELEIVLDFSLIVVSFLTSLSPIPALQGWGFSLICCFLQRVSKQQGRLIINGNQSQNIPHA